MAVTISDNEVYLLDDSLNEKQIKIREFIKCFTISLKMTLHEANDNLFFSWGFNSCRQTAFLINKYLKDNKLASKSTVFSAMFYDGDGMPEYEHFFVLCEIDGDEIIIDYSRTEKPLVFCKLINNNIMHFYDSFIGYEKVIIVNHCSYSDERYYKEFNVNEYFTNKNGEDLYNYVYDRANKIYQVKTSKNLESMFNKLEENIFSNLTFLYKDSYNKKVFYPQLLKNLQEGGLND
jgi:hypothetical protein